MKRSVIITAILLISGIAIYFAIDPGEAAFMPRCLFKTLTGLDCPGCGAQRLFHALLHGEIIEAFHYNPLLFILLPLFPPLLWLEFNPPLETVAGTGKSGISSLRYSGRYHRLYRRINSRPAMVIAVATIILWLIIRNII